MSEIEKLTWIESIVSSVLVVSLASFIVNIVITMNSFGVKQPKFYTSQMIITIFTLMLILTPILKYDLISKIENYLNYSTY